MRMNIAVACLTLVVWTSMAFCQESLPTWLMNELSDDTREYHLRKDLTAADSHGLLGMSAAKPSCTKPANKFLREQQDAAMTAEGKELCFRLSKVRGLLSVKLSRYSVEITKAKAFNWDELEAAIRPILTKE